MAYTWITPKTDWTASTYFTYTDYNRIRNNLLFINDKINEIYPDKAETLDLGDPKSGYDNNYHASEFNAFEDALVSFTRIGINVNLGDKKVHKPNNPFILYTDLNRIESCCLAWKNKDLSPTVESVALIPDHVTIANIGDTQQLSIVVEPSNAQYTVTWSSNNTSAATVNSNGLVTGTGEGSFTITAKVKSGDKTYTLQASGRIESLIGTTFMFNGVKYYYDFVYHGRLKKAFGFSGSNIEGELLLPRYRTSALSAKWGSGRTGAYVWSDYDADYHKVIEDFVDAHFSENLKWSLYSYYTNVLEVVGEGVNAQVLYESNGRQYLAYLPTIETYGLDLPSNADPSGIAYNYGYVLKNKYTDSEINGVPLISGTDKGQLIMVRLKNGDNYTMARMLGKNVYSAGLDEVLPIRPLFAVSSNSFALHKNPNSDGSYSIDWSNHEWNPEKVIKITDLPFGTIIRDDSGV